MGRYVAYLFVSKADTAIQSFLIPMLSERTCARRVGGCRGWDAVLASLK